MAQPAIFWSCFFEDQKIAGCASSYGGFVLCQRAMLSRNPNARKHKGEPKLPFNLSLRVLFFYYWGAVIYCFWKPWPFTAVFFDPHPGSRANVFFWALICFFAKRSNQFGSYLKVVLLFSARLRVTPKSTLKSTPSPKKSVSYVSAVLFLLCQIRFILFLLVCRFLFLLCHRDSRRRANF